MPYHMQLTPNPTVSPMPLEPLSAAREHPVFSRRDELGESRLAHPAVEAWTALTHDPVLPVVEILKYKNKSKVFRLRRPGVNSPAVIAKWCRSETAALEKLIYDKLLSQLPGPVLRCYGSVSEPRAEFAWNFIEDATGREYSRQEPTDRALAGRWLATLHNQPFASTRDLAAVLPDRSPGHYLQILRAARK